MTDAAILARGADGTFVVITAGRTLDADLHGTVDALESVGARTLGVVINRMAKRRQGYGDYRYYSAPTEPAQIAAPSGRPPKHPARGHD